MSVAVRVIPCLDVDGGRVVKGVNFENLRDAGDPVELAARYDAEGADELTFLDITASSGGRATMYDVVQTRVYVTDISRWDEVGEAHRLAFELAPPASTMVQVSALIDPRLLVEVEAVAHREGGLDADEEEPDDSEAAPDAIRLDDPSPDDTI